MNHHIIFSKSQQIGEKPTKISSVNTKQQSRLKYSQSLMSISGVSGRQGGTGGRRVIAVPGRPVPAEGCVGRQNGCAAGSSLGLGTAVCAGRARLRGAGQGATGRWGGGALASPSPGPGSRYRRVVERSETARASRVPFKGGRVPLG